MFCQSRSGVTRHNYSIDLGEYDKAVCCVIIVTKVGLSVFKSCYRNTGQILN